LRITPKKLRLVVSFLKAKNLRGNKTEISRKLDGVSFGGDVMKFVGELIDNGSLKYAGIEKDAQGRPHVVYTADKMQLKRVIYRSSDFRDIKELLDDMAIVLYDPTL